MAKTLNNYFHLFSDCTPVKGYLRTVIIDFNEKTYFFIPNELNDVLSSLSKSDIKFVKKKFNNEFDAEIDGFCNNLILQNKGFYSQTKFNFPPLNKEWVIPYKISNIVLNLNINLGYNALPDFETDCLGIYINEYNEKTINELNSIIKKIKHNTLQFFITFKINNINLESIIKAFSKLSHLHLLFVNKNSTEIIGGVVVTYNHLENFINKDNLTINLKLYTESQKHNTYYNRKLFIGAKGEIKNSTEAPKIFGNINDLNQTDNILKIINSIEFQKYWFIHKDLIDVCKHCEFRHMCVDNRLPVQRNNKEWFMETECNYNPYIAKWQGEEGYKTLSECGITSNQDGFKINRKKLNAINKELLGND